MTKVARIILAIILLFVVGLCIFGFLATLEPSDRNMIAWRIGYIAIGGVALLGAVWLVRLVWSDKTTKIND